MKTVTIYTTFPTRSSARNISQILLKKRLVACANICPVESIYRWDGKIKKGLETAAFFKTKKILARSTIQEIERLHPYDIPSIEVTESEVNLRAQQWMSDELQ